MVKGLGVDIVEIGRIEQLIERYGDHFLKKVYTAEEIRFCSMAARAGIHFAGRWAAKEAIYKALPPACQSVARWRGVQVLAPPQGPRRPTVEVVDPDLAASLATAGVSIIHLSISHEKDECVAVAIVE